MSNYLIKTLVQYSYRNTFIQQSYLYVWRPPIYYDVLPIEDYRMCRWIVKYLIMNEELHANGPGEVVHTLSITPTGIYVIKIIDDALYFV